MFKQNWHFEMNALYLHFHKNLLHFGTLCKVLIKCEKVLVLKLLHTYCIIFTRWQSRNIQSFLDPFSIFLILCENFYYTAININITLMWWCNLTTFIIIFYVFFRFVYILKTCLFQIEKIHKTVFRFFI